MKLETPSPDLIDAWLTASASRSDCHALGKAIARDPQAAFDLVHQARAEVALRCHFAPPTPTVANRFTTAPPRFSVTGRRRGWYIAFGITATAAAALVFRWPVAAPTVRKSAPLIAKTVPREMRRLGLRETQAATAVVPKTQSGTSALEARLNRYWLNGGTHVSMDVSSAMQRLRASIEEANVLKRPELKSLNIEVQKPEGMVEPRVIFSDRTRTAGTALRLMAAQANATVSFEDPKVVVTLREPVPPEKGIIDTCTYRVSHSFLQDLTGLSPLSAAGSDSGIAAHPEDFASNILAMLAGLSPSRIKDWSYDPERGRLQLAAAPSEQVRIRSVLEALDSSPNSGQIFMTWKFIEIPAGMKVEDQIMSDKEFQLFTRELSGTAGVDLVSYPPVISQNGSPGTLQSTHDVNTVTETGETLTDFTGIRIEASPAFKGEVVVMEGTTDIGIPEGQTVRHTMVDFSATLQDGQTAVMLFPSLQPGRQTIAAITARPIDAAGQPQEDSGALPAAGDSPDK